MVNYPNWKSTVLLEIPVISKCSGPSYHYFKFAWYILWLHICGYEPFFVNHSHCILIFFPRLPVGPVAEMPETPTHLSLLSDSIMRTPALNELPDHDKEG